MIITHLFTDNTLTMKPTIYIGLGGTGFRAVSHTKKMYEDMYGVGNIPPHIAFLVLDYDYSEYTSPHLATSIEDDAVPLNYNVDPRDYYRAHVVNSAFNWFFESNTCFLGHRSPYRTNGRFYTELQRATIEQALQARWQQVTNFIYGVAPANIDVHIVTSFCGGTGAGSFINIAELVQRNFGNRANIIGHGVMHGIFRAMDPCPTRRPFHHINAYSSILDLDYLMSASMDNPITFEINGATRTFTRPLFDEFFVIDNSTPNGVIVNQIDTLCENIGVYLFADNLNSQHAGFGAEWFNGMYNILNKKGWVQSYGACLVAYKGEELADLYAKRYAAKLIEKMLQQSDNPQDATMEWIRDIGLHDDLLIDQIFDSSRILKLREPVTNIYDTFNITNNIISHYINNLHEINTGETIASLREEYTHLIVLKIEELQREGKVAETRLFLESLICILKNLIQKNETEATDLRNNEFAKNSRFLKMAMTDYENSRNNILYSLLTHRAQVHLYDVNNLAKNKLKIAYEIKRREIAVEIYKLLIWEADCKLREIEGYIHTLENLRNEYTMAANECMLAPYNVFEYDLSKKERVEMHVDDSDVDLQAFCTKFYKPILEMDIEHELKPVIYNFAKSRPQAMQYIEKSLADVINEMSDEEFELLRDKIIRLSSPWLQINDREQKNFHEMRPSEIMNHKYVFSFYGNEGDYNRLEYSLPRNTMADFVQHNYGQLHQKMFVTRKDVAIIPYCIDSLKEHIQDLYERELRNSMACNPHFDKTLFEEMRKKDFKLKPECPESIEDTLKV